MSLKEEDTIICHGLAIQVCLVNTETSKKFRRNVKISNLPRTECGFSGSWECSQAAQTMFSSLLSCRYIGKSIERKCAMLLLLLLVFHE